MAITIDHAKQTSPGAVIEALSDPTRRRIVELVARAPMTATQIHGAFPIANPAVSRHLRVLREAGLIAEQPVEHDRRIRLYALDPRALEELARWIHGLASSWQQQLDAFESYVRAVRLRRE